jgi:hypothetical protein
MERVAYTFQAHRFWLSWLVFFSGGSTLIYVCP